MTTPETNSIDVHHQVKELLANQLVKWNDAFEDAPPRFRSFVIVVPDMVDRLSKARFYTSALCEALLDWMPDQLAAKHMGLTTNHAVSIPVAVGNFLRDTLPPKFVAVDWSSLGQNFIVEFRVIISESAPRVFGVEVRLEEVNTETQQTVKEIFKLQRVVELAEKTPST